MVIVNRRESLLKSVIGFANCGQYLQKIRTDYGWNDLNFESGSGKNVVASTVEVVQELNNQQLNQLWKGCFNLCVEALQILSNEIMSEKKNDIADQVELNQRQSFSALELVSLLLFGALKMDQPVITDEMVQCGELLHGSVFDLHEIKPVLGIAVCKICVVWWKSSARHREKLCLNAITLLLRIYIGNHKNKIFNEVYSMHDCLSLFDFKRRCRASDEEAVNVGAYTESIVQELRCLIVECFHKLQLRDNPPGRKFLSFALLLHEDLMKDIHLGIMESIHHKFPIMRAEAIGQLYYYSWRSSDEKKKELFEEICIQDLMFRAVHSPCVASQNLFSPYRAMIMSFTFHNSSAEVRHMISRLYSPILWRSLKVPNLMVRANAGRLLADAFPMVEMRSNQLKTAEDERFMGQQLEAFHSLLLDDSPKIRVMGCMIVADVLHSYWETTPVHTIHIMIQRMFNELVFDTVAEVRQAVFKATIILLDNVFSHPVLGKVLPVCMKNSLHDANLNVRVAVADVLLSVMKTSSISFYSLCSVESIMAQLEIGSMPIVRRLVKLLTPSYIPRDKPVQIWVSRCIHFYEKNINAARRFYSQISKELTNQEIGEFLHCSGLFTLNAASHKFRQEQSSCGDSLPLNDASNTESPELSVETVDYNALCAVLDTSCILWKLFGDKNSRQLKKDVMITFSQAIHTCFKIASDERMLNALLLLSSFLPPASIPVFSKSVIPKLRSLHDDAPPSYYKMLIKCTCCWEWTSQILELLNEWLCEAVAIFSESSSGVKAASKSKTPLAVPRRRSARQLSRKENKVENLDPETKGKKKKKIVTFNEHIALKPTQALNYLKSFLQIQSESSYNAFSKQTSREILMSIVKNLGKCQTEISNRLSSSSKPNTDIWSDDMLVDSFSLRNQILTILYRTRKIQDEDTDRADDVDLSKFVSVISWMLELLHNRTSLNQSLSDRNGSVLLDVSASANTFSRLHLFRKLFVSGLERCLEFMLCGLDVFKEVEEMISYFCQSDVNLTDYASPLLQIILQLHEYAAFRCLRDAPNENHFGDELDHEEKSMEKLPSIFDNWITTLLQLARKDPANFTQLFRQHLRFHLKKLAKELNLVRSRFPNRSWYNALIGKIVSAIFADLYNEIKSCQHLLVFHQMSELPVFSLMMLSVICSTSSESSYVCENIIVDVVKADMLGDLKSKEMAQIVSLLLHVLLKDGKCKPAAESCKSALSKDFPLVKKAFDDIAIESCLSEKKTRTLKDTEANASESPGIIVLENPEAPDLLEDEIDLVL